MFKFLHAADIHLDSPLRGLQRYEGAPAEEIRQASRRALQNLVQLAIDQSVAFVLIAGDLYDGDWKDHRTGLYFVSQMVHLREAGIPVIAIAGNHDAANKMTRTLPLPENVRILDHKRPETFLLEQPGVAIHGQSFATAAVLEDLSAAYPPAVGGMLNIGLLHTCATGREGHQPYAPCTIPGLISKHYDYWALGHAHGQEVLNREPEIIFSGNVQGRHIHESGPKGCMLVEVDAQQRLQPEFRPLDVFRWQPCWVDAAGTGTKEDLLDRFRQRLANLMTDSDGLSLAVRVETSGPCAAHQEIAARPEQWISDIRSTALDLSGGRVWIEKVRTATTLPMNLDEALLSDGPLGELARLIEELRGDSEAVLRLLADDLGELRKKLPPELTEGPEAIDLGKPDRTGELLDQVRQMLVGQMRTPCTQGRREGGKMKILRLDLRAFGPFTDVSLDLAAGSQGFHLVYGPNEAGKSSALRALRNLLYGIPGNTSDHFLHDYRNLRIGATLVRRDGQQLEIVRRKGYKDTLLPPDEKEPLDESVLHGFLGGCDQAQFETMFGIDHAGLIAGGRDIIRGEGDIGQVLFAAGAGISDLRTIRDNLEKQAEGLFSPRGLKPAVNQALTELHKTKKLIRDSQLPSSEWQKHKAALDDAARQLTAIEEKLGDLSRQKTRLQRLAGALPAIGRLRECDEKLIRLGDLPILPADFAENRRDTISRLETARQAEQDALTEIARLDGLIATLAVPEGLVSRAAEIEAVYKEFSVYRKAQADLPGLTANREHLEKEAAALLHELRPELTLADADQLILSRRQQVEIQNLGNRKEALEKQLLQARSEIADSRQRLAETSDQLAQLPPPCDPAPLAEALRRARSQGNLSQQTTAGRAEIAALTTQASIDLNKLGLWSGSLEALEELALPAAETIARFDRNLAAAQAVIDRVQGQLEKARGDAADIERELERLRLEGEVPSEAELAKARKLRDADWRLVLQDWRKVATDTAALQDFLAAAGDIHDLAAAYEQTVRRADDLSDRLRREANRVASRATLQAQQLSLQQQTAELDRQQAAALEQLQQIEIQWRQLWQLAGIDPLPPREMQAWIQRQQGLVQQAQAIRQRTASLAQLEEQIAAHCRHVRQAFEPDLIGHDLIGQPGKADVRQADHDHGYMAPEPDLDALLARGDSLLEQIKDAADSRRQLEREKNRLAKAATQAEAKAVQAEADLSDWRTRWTAAIQPIGLPSGASPVAVNEVVAQTAELHARLKEAAGFVERIEGIGRESLRFRQDAQRLLQTAGPTLIPEFEQAGRTDPDHPTPGDRFEEALEELFGRLRRAMTDQKNLDLLQSQGKEQEEKRQQAHTAVETLRARLTVLCQEARCQGHEGLPAAEAASAEVLRLRQEQETCHTQLLELAAGATIETLMTEAAAILPDSLPGELQQIADAMSDLERTRGELREKIGGEKTVLAGMDTSAAAAEAAEDAQDILARLEPDVQQYLRLRLASAVLREGIERYRKKNEGPVLGRASDLFRRLTLGSFEALRIDFDDDGEQVLAGLRSDGKAVLPSAMSEGTCDQLYLALRLASLEIWLEWNEPMPFIVDDILVSFDNQRAVATLQVLAELSTQAQVIFFAHHEHLVDLATQCMPGDVLFVHRL